MGGGKIIVVMYTEPVYLKLTSTSLVHLHKACTFRTVPSEVCCLTTLSVANLIGYTVSDSAVVEYGALVQ